ncbi:MAG: hypothetical protein LBR56_01445 [Sporomusaceae bacterium]|jgi:hypothetical protein|nr:hypothetical protein [Sporomusaceae bacterium]
MVNKDPIVSEVWKTREQLIEQHGSLENFLEHIKQQEQQHSEKLVDPTTLKKTADKRLAF